MIILNCDGYSLLFLSLLVLLPLYPELIPFIINQREAFQTLFCLTEVFSGTLKLMK